MTDIRIVTRDGKRLELETLTSIEGDALAHLTRLGLPGTLYNRSSAPTKREVRAASGKQGRKQHNWRKQQHLNSPTPPKPPRTPGQAPGGRLAGIAGVPKSTRDRNDLSASPFKDAPRGARRSMYTTW